jgi:hypothetical protein
MVVSHQSANDGFVVFVWVGGHKVNAGLASVERFEKFGCDFHIFYPFGLNFSKNSTIASPAPSAAVINAICQRPMANKTMIKINKMSLAIFFRLFLPNTYWRGGVILFSFYSFTSKIFLIFSRISALAMFEYFS